MPFRNSIVGGSGALIRESIKSPNFQLSDPVQGWEIRKDGTATFNNVIIGSQTYTISEEGDASFRTLDVTGVDTDADGSPDSGLTIYGKDFLSYLGSLPKGLLEWRRNSTSTYQACTTEVGLGQLTAYTVPGRRYRISVFGLRATADSAPVQIQFEIRYLWGTGGISLSNFTSYITYLVHDVANSTIFQTVSPFGGIFTGNGHVRFLIVAKRVTGTGNCTTYWDAVSSFNIILEDLGLIDLAAWEPNNGGGSGAPSTAQYVSTWQATGSATYRGDGSTRTDTTDASQGYYTSTNGNQHSKVVFTGNAISGETTKTIAQALTGAVSIDKVEIWAYANHWYYGAGGTAIIRPWNSTALNNTIPSGASKAESGWPRYSGRWVDITSVSSLAIRGFSFGQGPTTAGEYYGRFGGATDANKPLLRLTYTR